MANTLTLSLSWEDMQYLNELDINGQKANKVPVSSVFRGALFLYRRMDAFMDIYCLEDYAQAIIDLQKKVLKLNEEILKREEKIDSLKNVLEEKIITERRLRKTVEGDNRTGSEDGALEALRRDVGEQHQELAWPRKPQT